MTARTLISLLALFAMAASVQAQTCNADITATAPDSRYTDNGDGTVTDTTTGLMWKQCPEGLSGADCATGGGVTYTWQGALEQAVTVNSGGFAGQTDWRLPNLKELASLVETKCYSSAINATLFPNTPSLGFWSASPYADGADRAWFVNFDSGLDFALYKYDVYYVRLVRGGQ